MNGGDPAFKLFGRKIPVPETQIAVVDKCSEKTSSESEVSPANIADEPDKPSTVENGKEETQTNIQMNESQVSSKPKGDQQDTSNAHQEKVFKKPDKVLPCPRCNSFETKFCYFNNYNVNQPRHFCKSCQRYWTAGGTMRNVPIGAGRRKNKHLASQYRQIIVSSDGVPVTQIEAPDSAAHQLLPSGESATAFRPSMGNGTVLKFGAEIPLCESIETVLSLGDQKSCVEVGAATCAETQEEPSSGSSTTSSSIHGNELPGVVEKKEPESLQGSNEPHMKSPRNCYPVPSWVFPWSPGMNKVAPMAAGQCTSERAYLPINSNSGPVQWVPTPMVAVPGFCPPNIPLQFVPASYWGCMPLWTTGAGNMTYSSSGGCLSPSSSTSNSGCSGNSSPTLGKHSREANLVEEEQSEKCVLVPKTIRIDDPREASRSPIWATLGIKPNEKDHPTSGGAVFQTFVPKSKGKDLALGGTHILEANPAALSRSHTFQEST